MFKSYRLKNLLKAGLLSGPELDALIENPEYLGALYDLRNRKSWMEEVLNSPLALSAIEASTRALYILADAKPAPLQLMRHIRGKCLADVAVRDTTGMTAGYSSICRSPELGLYMAIPASGNGARSGDGRAWTPMGGATGNKVIWVPELHMFVADRRYSLTGMGWLSFSSFPTSMNNFCWCPEILRFAACGSSTARAGTLGGSWPNGTGVGSDNYLDICWSPELSMILAISANSFVKSMDRGATWATGSIGSSNNRRVCWSSELRLFATAGSGGFFLSPDSESWFRIEVAGEWQDIVPIPEWRMLFAVGTNIVGWSFDGFKWETKAVSESWNGACWAPDLKLISAVGATANKVVESVRLELAA